MRVHVYAANKVKESIVNHCVEENPELNPADVLESTAQGNILSDSIQNTMQQIVDDEDYTELNDADNRKNIDELATTENERYAICLDSVQSSNKYIQWLSLSRFTDFTQQNNKENAEYLKEKMEIYSQNGLELYQAKQKFAELLQGDFTPEKSMINELLKIFLESVVGQLQSQQAVFEREINLGNLFSSAVQKFFCGKFRDKKIKPDPSVVRSIEWAFSIIKDNQIDIPGDIDPLDVVAFEETMDKLDAKLHKRRIDYDNLHSLIELLEKAIAKLETVVHPAIKARTKTVSSRMIYPVKKR